MRLRMSTDEALRILDLPFDTTADQVKRVYRKLALKYHPDVNKAPDATKQFVRVNEAYQAAMDFLDRRSGRGQPEPEVVDSPWRRRQKRRQEAPPHSSYDYRWDGYYTRERARRSPPPPPPPPKPEPPPPPPKPTPQSFPEWRRSAKGNLWCEVNGKHVVVMESRYFAGTWTFAVNGDFSKGVFLSEEMAKEAALKEAGFASYTKTKEYVPHDP